VDCWRENTDRQARLVYKDLEKESFLRQRLGEMSNLRSRVE
jgi:hypothetical protein